MLVLLLRIFIIAIFSRTVLATNQATIFLQKGHKYSQEKEYEKAITEYKNALNIDPNYVAAKSSLESASAKLELIKWSKTNISKTCQNRSPAYEYACLDNEFVIDGKPVNPFLIKDFSTWISDGGNQVVAIDIMDSQFSNRYFCDSEIQIDGDWISCTNIEKLVFRYKNLGRSSSGTRVLLTNEYSEEDRRRTYPKIILVYVKKELGRILLYKKSELSLKWGSSPNVSLKNDQLINADGKVIVKVE